MFSIECYKCKLELDQPGAVLFSPPDKFNQVFKIHICWSCWTQILMSGIISTPPKFDFKTLKPDTHA